MLFVRGAACACSRLCILLFVRDAVRAHRHSYMLLPVHVAPSMVKGTDGVEHGRGQESHTPRLEAFDP